MGHRPLPPLRLRLPRGWKRTLAFLPFGYGVAFASEYASIHTGFPYGLYAYLPDRFLHRELWINGEVPFMDSLSYVFLNRFWRAKPDGSGPKRHTVVTVLLGAALVTWLDMIIDPVSLRGEEWFLGKIYHYPGGGSHFGVPWTNYAGWFITGCAIQGGLALAERRWPAPGDDTPGRVWMGAAIYAGVALFILSVAWVIDIRKGAGVSLALWNTGAFALVAVATWGARRRASRST
ncbi:MAG: carotenoid biosynthesis protein [Planctomycetota bacterium]